MTTPSALSPRAALALSTLRRLRCTPAEARGTATTLRARGVIAPLCPDDEAVIEACDQIVAEQVEASK